MQAFKRTIAQIAAAYHDFETTEDFRTKARMHLSKVVQAWLDANASGTIATKPTSPAPNSDNSPCDPLANLTALTDDDYEEGLIELSERAEDAMQMVVSIVQKMSDATNELGAKFTQRTEEINKLKVGGAALDMKSAKRVSNNAASDLEMYVNRLSTEIPAFHEQHSLAMDTFGNIAIIVDEDMAEDPEDIQTAMSQIRQYRDAISTSSDRLTEFRGTIAGLPRMTTAFNRAPFGPWP